MTGDTTGLIEIENGIRVAIAEQEARTNIFCNVRIQNGGELVSAPDLYIHQGFDVLGSMYGMENVWLAVRKFYV